LNLAKKKEENINKVLTDGKKINLDTIFARIWNFFGTLSNLNQRKDYIKVQYL